MTNTSHLDGLRLRLSHAKEALAAERSDAGRRLRAVWVQQTEREIAAELRFLGLPPESGQPEIDDDQLLADLQS